MVRNFTFREEEISEAQLSIKPSLCRCLPKEFKYILNQALAEKNVALIDRIKAEQNFISNIVAKGLDSAGEELERTSPFYDNFDMVKFTKGLFPEDSEEEIQARLIKSARGIIKVKEEERELFQYVRQKLRELPACESITRS